MNHRCLLIVIVVAAAAAACDKGSSKSKSSASGPTPSVEQVMNDYLEATGGRAAHESVKTLHIWITAHIAKANIDMKGEIMMQSPNLAYNHLEMSGMGAKDDGFDGTVVWERSDAEGARILTGSEREHELADKDIDDELHWRDLYPKIAVVGPADFEGRPAWKLERTNKAGELETHYYDRETHLDLGGDDEEITDKGKKTHHSRVVSYKQYGPIKQAAEVEMTAGGMNIHMTIDKAEVNQPLPPDAFALPPDVAALPH